MNRFMGNVRFDLVERVYGCPSSDAKERVDPLVGLFLYNFEQLPTAERNRLKHSANYLFFASG